MTAAHNVAHCARCTAATRRRSASPPDLADNGGPWPFQRCSTAVWTLPDRQHVGGPGLPRQEPVSLLAEPQHVEHVQSPLRDRCLTPVRAFVRSSRLMVSSRPSGPQTLEDIPHRERPPGSPNHCRVAIALSIYRRRPDSQLSSPAVVKASLGGSKLGQSPPANHSFSTCHQPVNHLKTSFSSQETAISTVLTRGCARTFAFPSWTSSVRIRSPAVISYSAARRMPLSIRLNTMLCSGSTAYQYASPNSPRGLKRAV